MTDLVRRLGLVGMLLLVTGAARQAKATVAPADPCSLLPAEAVGKTTGARYNMPQQSVAPRPYVNTVQGTDCLFAPKGSGDNLLFRIYFDPSAGDATMLFAKLKMFYGPSTAVSGIGDEAYFDERGELHARKGNVRFYLELGEHNPTPLKALGVLVAGQL
jgi:hypothetical protein